MFDIGWQELLLICAVTVIIVGPRELPRVVRGVTGFIRKARMLASEFQSGLTDIADVADLADLKKGVESIKDGSLPKRIASATDPTGMLSDSVQELQSTQEKIATTFNRQTEEIKSAEIKSDTGKTSVKKIKAKQANSKKVAKKSTVKKPDSQPAIKPPRMPQQAQKN